MRIPAFLKSMLVATAVAIASACGGGSGSGSGGDGSSGTTSLGANAAWQNFLRGGKTVSVATSPIDFNPYTGRRDVFESTYIYATPDRAQAPAGGSQQWRMRVSSESKWRGSPEINSGVAWIDFFYDDSFKIVGIATSAGACAAASGGVLPPDALVNLSSGPLAMQWQSVPCGPGGAAPSTLSLAWNITNQETAAPFFCARLQQQLTGRPLENAYELCFQTDASGQIGQGARAVYFGESPPIVLRNYTPL